MPNLSKIGAYANHRPPFREFPVRHGQTDPVHRFHAAGKVLGDSIEVDTRVKDATANIRTPGTQVVVESPLGVRLPKRYTSDEGQLLEHAPYWERDFRRPTELCDLNDQTPTDVLVVVGERYRLMRTQEWTEEALARLITDRSVDVVPVIAGQPASILADMGDDTRRRTALAIGNLGRHGSHLPEAFLERGPVFEIHRLAQLLAGPGRALSPRARPLRIHTVEVCDSPPRAAEESG